MAVSFIGGGNSSTLRKPPTCHKSLTNYHIMLYQVHLDRHGVRTRNVSLHLTLGCLWFDKPKKHVDSPFLLILTNIYFTFTLISLYCCWTSSRIQATFKVIINLQRYRSPGYSSESGLDSIFMQFLGLRKFVVSEKYLLITI